jgi:hypothetical protein
VHIHPAIAALRSDRASQRSLQEPVLRAAEQWRQHREVHALAGDLAAYDAGAPLDACPVLARLLSDRTAATGFVHDWSERMVGAMRASPLAEVPYQHRCSSGFSTLRLLTHGTCSLSLSAYERRDDIVAGQSAVFVDRESVEIAINGAARGLVYALDDRAGETRIVLRHCEWQAGDVIVTGPREARQFVDVAGSLLVLQLTRAPRQPEATREYRLADGALVRSASGDKNASRAMLALGVLGALESPPALDAMAQVALDQMREPDLRWEAVRQLLALDAAQGFALLGRLADDQHDPLSEPSRRLKHQLAAAYPQLVALAKEAV